MLLVLLLSVGNIKLTAAIWQTQPYAFIENLAAPLSPFSCARKILTAPLNP